MSRIQTFKKCPCVALGQDKIYRFEVTADVESDLYTHELTEECKKELLKELQKIDQTIDYVSVNTPEFLDRYVTFVDGVGGLSRWSDMI